MTRGVPAALLCSLVSALAMQTGCQAPEAFHKNADSGTVSFGTGGDVTSTGGKVGSGGSGSGGMLLGTGGAGTGGAGTGGAATGGAATGGAATGGAATGGAATGGSAAGGAATGGSAAGGAATGGSAAGGAGTAGRGTGAAGGAGRGTGGMANGGGSGGAGVGGNTGTGPCMGLCAGAKSVPPSTNSGPLGTAATCHEVIGMVTGVVCGNFMAARTFSVNGTMFACAGGNMPLPARRNGGYCMQTSAGNYSYAYFETY